MALKTHKNGVIGKLDLDKILLNGRTGSLINSAAILRSDAVDDGGIEYQVPVRTAGGALKKVSNHFWSYS